MMNHYINRFHHFPGLNSLKIAYGDNRSFKEAFSRIHGEAESSLSYARPGQDFLGMKIYAYDDDRSPNITFSISSDGTTYNPISAKHTIYASEEDNYSYLVPIEYALTKEQLVDANFVKFDFSDTSNIVRVEITYK